MLLTAKKWNVICETNNKQANNFIHKLNMLFVLKKKYFSINLPRGNAYKSALIAIRQVYIKNNH